MTIVLTLAFASLALFARTAVRYARTGRLSVRFARTPDAPGWVQVGAWSTVIGGGFAAGIAAPAIELLGAAPTSPLAPVGPPAVRVAGAVLAALALAATLAAQGAMGASWRIDVDPDDRTALVTGGPFALVRNPVYTAGLCWTAGIALSCPSVLSALGALAVVAGVQVQVRLVEEPHLARAHGAAYRAYAARVGRFLPGVGRMRPASPDGAPSTLRRR
ncbi:isoprenylcysteine carboxylmethyltransferase family protein [Streptomonospora sp. S1-112]|uniref:Isoprenylcysteine carboxylmethyltransferase family protein n=1 Tax=Streptomonospora mangrovi TaxID=2883123 RepID=A0A9X3SKU0_9ACTN|nr:methyltransferase [Streptomonospora mangrovi]MDA0563111.1 isoprenylcysteine carboxylmethyltransferase family protein [Streptomonospora mangrovi]